MGGCTLSAVVGRIRDRARPNGISLNVTNRVPEMCPIQDAGGWPLLPKMPNEPILDIEALRAGAIGAMKDSMNRIDPSGIATKWT
jgi:hypothetical protein